MVTRRLPSADEILIWIVRAAAAPTVAHLLTEPERDRARRFVRDDLSDLYTAAHGALRLILGRCLGVDGRSLRFGVAEGGKPTLASTPLRFNLAHSGDLAAVAVAVGREVGVDVERRRSFADAAELAQRVMVPPELARYHSLAAVDRSAYLLDVWTRKEALLKASGRGLAHDPSSLPASGDGRFSVRPFKLPGYAAAVAAEGPGWCLSVLPLPIVTDA